MRLWQFLRTESNINGLQLVAMAAVSGFSNALVMIIINAASEGASHNKDQQPSNFLFLAFVLTFSAFVLSQRYLLRITNSEIERMIGRLRTRIADKIRKADLQPIEDVGQARVFAALTRDTQTISQAASPAIIAIQSAIMVLFTAGYIAYLNFIAFIVTLGIIGLAVSLHFRQRSHLNEQLKESTAMENETLTLLTHLLQGFKEVKLNTERSNELNQAIETTTTSAVDIKVQTAVAYADSFIFSQAVLYILLAVIVFVLPRFMGVKYAGTVNDFTAAILFIIGPLSNLIGTIPLFSSAEVAVNDIQGLEMKLDELAMRGTQHAPAPDGLKPEFSEIRLTDVEFGYLNSAGEPAFSIGPINLSIKRPEIVFIVGGNGSGKSTLLKLLTGLYYPHSGKIELDGRELADVGYSNYRNLISAVFSDYHLFDHLYGVRARDEEVMEKLRYMQLSEKTKFENGRFSTQELSTGQRKRLALIVSLLEDRPILVVDEWAADQDPAFRERFYTELLPDLRNNGQKTIIAATHDDRYFYMADRVLKMEMGQLSVLKG